MTEPHIALSDIAPCLPDPDAPEPTPTRGRPAGILIPLYEEAGQIWMVLTQRTEDVPHHKGQISFPGGGVDAGDLSLRHTALREAQEEVGLEPSTVEIIGRLTPFVTITNYFVLPYAGIIPANSRLEPDSREIASILRVPLAHLADPRHHRTRRLPLMGRRGIIHYFDWQSHVIWGVTGHILWEFLELVRGGSES